MAQAPAHHWERAERANAHIYYSTREPKSVLIHLTGLTREERKALADMPIEVDLSALKYHDYDGFGVHLPGLIVTTQGQQSPCVKNDTVQWGTAATKLTS